MARRPQWLPDPACLSSLQKGGSEQTQSEETLAQPLIHNAIHTIQILHSMQEIGVYVFLPHANVPVGAKVI
jgi:hypothetical protein